MTPTEQRIAIAEACGRKFYFDTKLNQHIIDEYVPDYLHDLNAIHEALHGLDEAWKVSSYRSHLVKICGGTGFAIDATAAQRAEAFLRTIGKWKD